MKIKSKNKGFTLIELLIYTTIFALTAGVLTTILITTTRVENVEIVNNQVGQELNLVLETVQRLVRDSSLIECVGANQATCGASAIPGSLLRLRFQGTAKDPTCVYLDTGAIKLAGPDAANKYCNTATATNLTTDKVTANSLTFTKFDIPGGHATVQIDATLAYISTNPELQISKTLKSAVGRVSAATFDSNLLPNVNNLWDIGSITGPSYKWKNVYISNLLGLGTNTGDPAGIPGAIYFNTTGNNVKVYNGTSWKNVGFNGTLSSALTGTVSVTIGTAAVTGVGTLFTSELVVGDSIKIGSEIFTVSAITDNFNLTLDSNHIAGASGLTAYRDPDLFIIDNGDSINKLTVTRSGNIGIGITNPTQKLSVAGTLGILEGGASPIFNSIFQGGDQAANITYTLPITQGAASTTLTNNGSGVLSWAAAVGGGGGGSFGDGSDGDVTVSVNETLSTDKYYNNLTVNAGIVLNTGGYRIFVKGTLTNNGTIMRNGNAGGDGGNGGVGGWPLGGTAGTAGAALADGSLKGALAGIAGGAGQPSSGGYSNNANGVAAAVGTNGADVSKSLFVNSAVVGASGGKGGDATWSASTATGGAAAGGGGAGSKTGTVYNKIHDITSAYLLYDFLPSGDQLKSAPSNGGASGGSTGGVRGDGAGGSAAQSGPGGGGGGGGSNAGIVTIFAKIINNNGTISANGGNGGKGGNGGPGDLGCGGGQNNGMGGSGGGGGGAGGNGGILIIYYQSLTNTGAISATNGTGGLGGLSGPKASCGTGTSTIGDTGALGNNGANGVIIYLQS